MSNGKTYYVSNHFKGEMYVIDSMKESDPRNGDSTPNIKVFFNNVVRDFIILALLKAYEDKKSIEGEPYSTDLIEEFLDIFEFENKRCKEGVITLLADNELETIAFIVDDYELKTGINFGDNRVSEKLAWMYKQIFLDCIDIVPSLENVNLNNIPYAVKECGKWEKHYEFDVYKPYETFDIENGDSDIIEGLNEIMGGDVVIFRDFEIDELFGDKGIVFTIMGDSTKIGDVMDIFTSKDELDLFKQSYLAIVIWKDSNKISWAKNPFMYSLDAMKNSKDKFLNVIIKSIPELTDALSEILALKASMDKSK